jgi:phospholipid/cholesterol/gamma-HCH transport system substrate-binding protein
MSDRRPYKLYGALFLAVIVGLVVLAFAAFDRVFTPAAYVTVHIERAGLQLLPGSDVKLRGINVGTVDSISSDGNGATVRLRMTPSDLPEIPSNVSVRLVPKTLFGEKYVDLQLPATAASTHLVNGASIAEDRSKPALEIDQALNNLLPVLRTVQPQDLDQTLTAIATALQGRGPALGHTIVTLDRYLRGLNPHLPRLRHDLSALSTTSRTYDEAAGPLLQTLGNLSVTSTTVTAEQTQLGNFLRDVTATADTTRQFLASNAHNLVAVNTVNASVISLLKRYSPEFPCFIKGDAGLVPRIHDAVPPTRGLRHAAHVDIEFVPAFPSYKYPIDAPQFGDTRGPECFGLPHPKKSLPVVHFKDGTQDDPRFANQGKPGPVGGSASDSAFGTSMGNAGTRQETRAFDNLLAPVLQTPATKVPDIADLLWGPMARGTAVKLS